MDTREYIVEFTDGHSQALSANLIAQNLFSQIDDKGNGHVLLEDIIDHRKADAAVSEEDAFVTMNNGVKRRQQTTQGWQLLCQWRNESTNWVALKEAKHLHPLKVVEYAYANRIQDEPAFAWWVDNAVKKHERICANSHSVIAQRSEGSKIQAVASEVCYQMERSNTLLLQHRSQGLSTKRKKRN
jgi:hypothetical protein